MNLLNNFSCFFNSDWVSQHNLSINGKRMNITKDDLVVLAKSMNIKKAAKIIQQIDMIAKKWYEFAEATKVDNYMKEHIGKSHLIL